MKHLLLFCLVALLGWSCKRTVEPNQGGSVDENEIQISASSATSHEGTGKASHNTVPDDFDALSSIGLFTQLLSDAGTTTLQPGNKANARFNYATPLWAPYESADRLRYHETDPIIIYGMFPHIDLRGSRIKQGTQPHLFDFWPAKNQSTADSVKMNNLMWCRADNNGTGYLRQGAPINMVFTHLMCRLSISVRVIDSRPAAGLSPTYIYLRSLSLGPNPNADPATSGQIGTKAQLNVLAREDGTGSNALLQTTEVGSITWDEGPLTPFKIAVTDASTPGTIVPTTFVTDLLLLPFEAKENENIIRLVTEYPEFGNSVHTFNSKIPRYDGMALPPNPATGNKWRFGRNDHVQMTITIDISTSYINLEATIKPWLAGPNNEIEADPE